MNTEKLYAVLEAVWTAEQEATKYFAPMAAELFDKEATEIGDGARDTILEMVREYDAAVTDEMLVGMVIMAEMFDSFSDRPMLMMIPTPMALQAASGTLLGLAARLWKERVG